MPQYTSDQKLRSGVPLGGIGAGKVEIMNNGTLDYLTCLNGCHNPIRSAAGAEPGVLGFHFALFCEDKKRKTGRLLQTAPVGDLPSVTRIGYDGDFPFARLSYEDASLPVACELEAYAPFVPRHEKASGIPCAIFRFKITNPWARPVSVALMSIGRNLIGEWNVGRFNQVVDDPHALHLGFYNKKTLRRDPLSGEMAISVLKTNAVNVSYLGEFNMQTKPFVFDKSGLSLAEPWNAFVQEGVLPNTNTERVVFSESVQLGGALAAQTQIKARSSVTITFILSWYAPNDDEGRAYEQLWRNVREVASHVVTHEKELHKATQGFSKSVHALKLESWLKDALLNNLYPLVSSSLWTKRGRFGLFEAPEVCPLLGTIDVRFYGSIPLALFFPSLETKELLQFAEVQRPTGYIPHDLGFKRSDLASNSTNGLYWKDLNSKFIVLCYRDFLWTGDEAFLRKVYPFAKKAFGWLAATDKNKDGLPDNEGADHTFDLWAAYGAHAYTSGIFLAALLALEKMAVRMNDEATAKEVRSWSKRGRASFEKKLWNKNYFMAYNNVQEGLTEKQLAHHTKTEKVSVACMAGQLVGVWAARLLGLGDIVSEDKVKKALSTILASNAMASPFGAVNAVLPSGEKDRSNLQSENCWFGMTYVVAGLAVQEGRVQEGLALAKKAWETASVHALNPWNQPDLYSSTDANFMFGDHYMRNMVIWSLVLDLARTDKALESFLGAHKR